MVKRAKLTHRQRRQVSRNRQRRLHQEHLPSSDQLGEQQQGVVVGRFGQHADIEDRDGNIERCHIRRTVESVVCGDQVLFSPGLAQNQGISGVVELVKDRHSLLSRPDYYDGIKPVAANIDQILIVSSVLPSLSLNIIDRYLVAAEDVAIQPLVILNKVELLDDNKRHQVEKDLKIYQQLGYQTLFTSCKSGEGLEQLAVQLKDRTSVFVGQSGVGKSSLINQLLPDADEITAEISQNSGLGQHTTTAAKLLHFPSGGNLIDSPGVREFALWHLSDEKVTSGFREFRPYLGGCKFRDCKHLDDPGCLISQAVEQGNICKQRYTNYHRILTSMKEQAPTYSKS